MLRWLLFKMASPFSMHNFPHVKGEFRVQSNLGSRTNRITNSSVYEQFGLRTNFPDTKRLG